MSGGMLGDLDGTTDAICNCAKVPRWVADVEDAPGRAPRRERARVEDSPRRAVDSLRRVRVIPEWQTIKQDPGDHTSDP